MVKAYKKWLTYLLQQKEFIWGAPLRKIQKILQNSASPGEGEVVGPEN